jgi:hypothetical protein
MISDFLQELGALGGVELGWLEPQFRREILGVAIVVRLALLGAFIVVFHQWVELSGKRYF